MNRYLLLCTMSLFVSVETASAQTNTINKKEEDPYIQNQVKNTIIKHSKQIQSCYLTYLETKPSKKEGLVKIDWQILSSGKVIKAELVASNFSNPTFESCVVKQVSKIEFPPTAQQQNKYVAHEFRFKEETALGK